MPRFYDDYGACFLTHDSAAGRKQQRRGWKFRENFKLYYSEHIDSWKRSDDGLAVAQQNYLAKAGCQPPALPEGWEEATDMSTGIQYFIETETGERTWARPGFIPPMGAPPMQQQSNYRPNIPQYNIPRQIPHQIPHQMPQQVPQYNLPKAPQYNLPVGGAPMAFVPQMAPPMGYAPPMPPPPLASF